MLVDIPPPASAAPPPTASAASTATEVTWIEIGGSKSQKIEDEKKTEELLATDTPPQVFRLPKEWSTFLSDWEAKSFDRYLADDAPDEVKNKKRFKVAGDKDYYDVGEAGSPVEFTLDPQSGPGDHLPRRRPAQPAVRRPKVLRRVRADHGHGVGRSPHGGVVQVQRVVPKHRPHRDHGHGRARVHEPVRPTRERAPGGGTPCPPISARCGRRPRR